ncbi:MAG TPA: HGGxSTG domain-containing protein [Alphaproteobacteria bacterium]|nr:HGGxSTG domain-containing protein [Alphaproteobacteria bacterium]
MQTSPRCAAKTRHGAPCKAPALSGKRRCRMHGGASPGAPKGNHNALKHGQATRTAKARDRALQQLLCRARATLVDRT